MKYSTQVGKLITKLQEEEVTAMEMPDQLSCQGCNCGTEEHEEYIYCPLIEGYLCRICCTYEVCNDHQLVNDILGQELFSSAKEIRVLCDKYCSSREYITIE